MTKNLRAYVEAGIDAFNIPNGDRAALWTQHLAGRLTAWDAARDATCPADIKPIGTSPSSTTTVTAAASATPWFNDERNAASHQQPLPDPVERVAACLAMADARADLNAFRYLDRDGAMQRARELQAQAEAGGAIGPLYGKVVAVKDNFAVRGMPTRAGTCAFPARTAKQSAPVVQQLERAGAIVLGITNMHELAYGATSENAHFGRVCHPLNASLTPGGSSGGSVVAVATGMADLALGTDTAGSVRMPAALCGVVGFKPSFNALCTTGVDPLAWSLDHIGLFATSVDDIALMFDASSPYDATSFRATSHSAASMNAASPQVGVVIRPSDICIVEPENYFFDVIDASVANVYRRAITKLRDAGISVQRGAITGLEMGPGLQVITMYAEASQMYRDLTCTNGEGLSEDTRERLESGQFISAMDYIKAQRLRQMLLNNMTNTLSTASVMVTPTVPIAACKPNQPVKVGNTMQPVHPTLTRCTLPFNLTGMPAVSIPCGVDHTGMPVGLQIAGPVGHDAHTLRVSRVIEAVLAQQ